MAAYDCPTCKKVHPKGCRGHISSDRPASERGRARKKGDPCTSAPIRGTDHCRSHGSAAPRVRAKGEERVEQAAVKVEAARLGVRVEVDPGEALLGALYAAWAELRYLEGRVGALDDDSVYGSLFYAPTKDRPEPTPTGEAKRHILVQMLEDATERVARISALALRAGVEERRVRLAEADTMRLAAEVVGALADIDAPAELAERFKAALAARLRALPAA